MALVDGNLGTAIYKAQEMVDDAFKEHEKHVTEIIVQNNYLLEDSVRLYEENDKLRELVRYMYRCFVRGHDWGPYCTGETVWVEDRMRELRIEVDG